MTSTVTKYIVIPDYAPLYAMHRCFGPTFAPLTRPTNTPIDVIGELLLQTGREKVSIFEVAELSPNKFSDPVQLNLENYMLPYDQITGHTESVEKKTVAKEVKLPEDTSVTPVIIESVKKEESKTETIVSADTIVEESEAPVETPIVTDETNVVTTEDAVTSAPSTTSTTEEKRANNNNNGGRRNNH